MARITLDFNGEIIFTAILEVRVSDINYGGHLGNDRLVAILQEARVKWLRSLGYSSELNIEKLGLIQADLCVQYKLESHLGDVLQVHLAITNISKVGFELNYQVLKDDSIVVAIASSTLVFYDYSRSKVASIPPNFSKQLV